MEILMPNGDLIFEDANEGVTVYGKETRERLTREALDLHNRRVLCHEDQPFVLYREVKGGEKLASAQTRENIG